jgi:molybdenum cofactor synthesis domain-containing protein
VTAVKAVVLVASNRAADGVYEDTSGPILVEGLAAYGFDVTGPVVVHDGEEVAQALLTAVADGADLVVTSGGTGLTSLDLTPEMTSRVVDFEVPGIAEMIRAAGLAKTPHAALSRGIAGVAGRTLIVNLAGSKGAAKDGLAVLTAGFVEHAVSQLHDGDHARTEATEPEPGVDRTRQAASEPGQDNGNAPRPDATQPGTAQAADAATVSAEAPSPAEAARSGAPRRGTITGHDAAGRGGSRGDDAPPPGRTAGPDTPAPADAPAHDSTTGSRRRT